MNDRQGAPPYMITQSLSSSFELWYPISWNVAGPFPGGGRAGCAGGPGGEGVRTRPCWICGEEDEEGTRDPMLPRPGPVRLRPCGPGCPGMPACDGGL